MMYMPIDYAKIIMNKRFILCAECKYFPNKADQIKKHGIRIFSTGIEWRCDACSSVNIYPGSQSIFLPETTLIVFRSENLLKNKDNANATALRIDINLDSLVQRKPLYYCPQLKEQIQKACKIELPHLKSIESLQKQSSWFAQYRSFLKSYAKMVNNSYEYTEVLALEDYLVYILEGFVNCQKQNIVISLTKRSITFYFNLTPKRDSDSPEIKDFLKIYALLQVETQQAWFLRLYNKLLTKYQTNYSRQQNICQVLLIDTKKGQKQSISDQYALLLRQTGRNDTNIFSISPLGSNPFTKHIQKLREALQRSEKDIVILFFKREGSGGILKKELSAQKVGIMKDIVFQGHTTTREKEELLSKHLKADLRTQSSSKARLLKLYCKFMVEGEEQTVLVTFNWHKIERELLVEELDDEVEEQHQLKEDILRQQYIKLQAPSPFLKKSQPRESSSPHKDHSQQEEYL